MTEGSEVAEASRKRSPARVGGAWAPAGFSWSLFEFARNPYYMLVVIYVFAPYFSKYVAGGGVEGSAKVADVITVSGVICALTAPFLGALMDRGGRRKAILAVFLASISICSMMLWWTEPQQYLAEDGVTLLPVPGAGGLGVTWTVVLLTVAFVAYTYSEVMHNAMLPASGVPKALPHISGLGLALGNFASVVGLLVVAAAATIPAIGLMDPPDAGVSATHSYERFTGPYTGLWMAIFVIPFFLYVPDGSRPGATWSGAARDLFGINKNGGFNPAERLRRFGRYFMDLFRTSPETMKFLIGRMIYADGLTAIMTLGGVYTATFLGWSGLETAIFGIYGSFFAALGGLLGGFLDQRFGAKRAIVIELSVIIAVLLVQLSITPTTIFFGAVPAGHAVWEGPVFQTLSDVSYLGFVAILACFITACISSSRYMLVAVAPKERIGEFFGFYAMAATLTVWMGPALYAIFSRTFDSQRVGMGSILILFFVGLAILLTVKHAGRPDADAKAPAH